MAFKNNNRSKGFMKVNILNNILSKFTLFQNLYNFVRYNPRNEVEIYTMILYLSSRCDVMTNGPYAGIVRVEIIT